MGSKRRLFQLGIGRPDPKEEVDWEVTHHLREQVDRLIEEGWEEDEAKREAERRFGDLPHYRKKLERMERRRRITELFGSFAAAVVHDVRFSARSIRKSPLLFLVAIGSLSVGVAVSTAVFGVGDTVVVRPLSGVSTPDQIVEIGLTTRRMRLGPCSYAEFKDLVDSSVPLVGSALFATGAVTWAGEEKGRRLSAAYVTAGYFELIGMEPIIGRSFLPTEELRPGDHSVAILSFSMWQDRLGGKLDVLGSTIRLSRRTYTVIGVTPEGFNGHVVGMDTQVFLPVSRHPSARALGDQFSLDRSLRWATLLGRLPVSGSIKGLNQALGVTFDRLAEEYPETNSGVSARAVRAGVGPPAWRGLVVLWFSIIGGLTLLVLGVTASNVGGMLLARAATRRREIAVRLSLGASRGRIMGHFFSESAAVFSVGGGVGIALAILVLTLDPNLLFSPPEPIPPTVRAVVDLRVVSFGIGITAVMAFLFGFIPAFQATRMGMVNPLQNELGSGQKRASKSRRILVGGQVGVAMLLLTTAALLVRTLQQGSVEEIAGVLDRSYITPFNLAEAGYQEPEAANVLLAELLARMRSLPEVENAAIATDFPLDNQRLTTLVRVNSGGSDGERRAPTSHTRVMRGYFRASGIDVRRGRGFETSDSHTGVGVVVINEMFVERAWPDGNPIGRMIFLGDYPQPFSVIGVVSNTRPKLPSDPYQPQVFSLINQTFDPRVRLSVTTRTGSNDMAGRIQAEIRAFDPELAPLPTRTHRAFSRDGMGSFRFAAIGASGLGLISLLLAGIGIYGIVAFLVVQMTRELGIRVALGASRRDVFFLVLANGVKLALPGLALGGTFAVIVAFLIRAGLHGVSPLDPLSLAAVGGLFFVLVLGACLSPTRTALSVQPADAIRHD